VPEVTAMPARQVCNPTANLSPCSDTFMMSQLLNSDLQESRHGNSIKNQLQTPVFHTQIRLIDIFGKLK